MGSLGKMLALKLLLGSVFLLAKSTPMVLEGKLDCLYPSKSSITPCTCDMQPEITLVEFKDEKVRSSWDYSKSFYETVEYRAFLGTFQKKLVCNLEETFSFAHIAQAFKDDNKIDEVKITGKHNRDYFVS